MKENMKPKYPHLFFFVYKWQQRYAHINGYSVVEEFCGHGIGMTMHEDPYVFHFKTKEDTVLIVPGMVFTIEPMLNQGTRHVHLNYNDDWTVYTDDGKLLGKVEDIYNTGANDIYVVKDELGKQSLYGGVDSFYQLDK